MGTGVEVNLPGSAGWEMAGTLNFQRATRTDGAELRGSKVNVSGTVNVESSALLDAPVDFQPSARVSAPGNSDQLVLARSTTYRGGSFTGAGRIRQNGHVSVAGDTTIDVASYDWDGNLVRPSNTTVNQGCTFTINSGTVGSDGSNLHRGQITVQGGRLRVTTAAPWEMGGRLALVRSGGINPDVYGAPMVISGMLDVVGADNAAIFSDVQFQPTAQTRVLEPAELVRLLGFVEYRGGSYVGLGTIRQMGFGTVSADTTIDAATFDWDGDDSGSQTTVYYGVTLTINSRAIDQNGGAYNGTINLGGATLVVNTPQPWALGPDAVVDLAFGMSSDGTGGRIRGAQLANAGMIRGFGDITTAGFVNDGQVVAQAMGFMGPGAPPLRIATTDAYPDLDGVAAGGVISAEMGSVVVSGPATPSIDFGGQIRVGTNQQFQMTAAGMRNTGRIELTGGTLTVPQLVQAGQLRVNPAFGFFTGPVPSTLQSLATFAAGSATTIDGDLRIVGAATVEAGATVTGAGRCIVAAGSTLGGNGTIGVTVENEGTVSPGMSPGTLTILGNYVQTPTGILMMEIAGTGSGLYDRLIVSGDATLGGTVVLNFVGGFAPRTGDVFDLLQANGQTNPGGLRTEVRNLAPGFLYDTSLTEGTFRVRALNDAVAVPEPATALMLLALGVPFAFTRTFKSSARKTPRFCVQQEG
jgi:hypothetical protein